MIQTMSPTKRLCVSAVVMALYVTVMYATQSFAFGVYQIRIATSLYALSYGFPFLIVPLGLSNGIGNYLGGFGALDIAGGAAIGLITSGAVSLIRRFQWPKLLIVPAIILGPGLAVPLWLSPLTGVPYPALALSLCIGQTLPAILGYGLVRIFSRLGLDRV